MRNGRAGGRDNASRNAGPREASVRLVPWRLQQASCSSSDDPQETQGNWSPHLPSKSLELITDMGVATRGPGSCSKVLGRSSTTACHAGWKAPWRVRRVSRAARCRYTLTLDPRRLSPARCHSRAAPATTVYAHECFTTSHDSLPPGSRILACAECKFTICSTCNCRPRLPPLEGDPLFCGPHSPRLLVDPGAIAGKGKGTVIVCPGGNYEFLSPKEGLPVVEWLASRGIAAVVLRYRLLPHHDLQDALDDLDAAIALVRQARGGPVAAIGFSAGGHLVASHSLRAEARRAERVQTRSTNRPLDAQMLIYPAIDGTPWADPEKADFFNRGEGGMPKKATALLEDTDALLGGEGFAAPPTFLVGSTGDSICPPRVRRLAGIACQLRSGCASSKGGVRSLEGRPGGGRQACAAFACIRMH